MRDTVLQLRDENETLTSEKQHLQASKAESEAELKTREDLVQQKETELAAEEARLDSLGQQNQIQSQQNQAQVVVVKKFNDLIRKLGKDNPPDVLERGGRPVLRVPNAQLFAPSDATLKPEGKTLLNQIAQALNGQMDNFELRVVTYTDTDAEATAPDATKKDPNAKPAPATDSGAKTASTTSWDLTASRAIAIERFYRDQTSLPFLNVLVMARGDSEPISKENHARNRRVEITIAPLPVPFHAPEPDKDKTNAAATGATDSSAPSTDAPPAPKKDKPKVKKADTDSDKTPPSTKTH